MVSGVLLNKTNLGGSMLKGASRSTLHVSSSYCCQHKIQEYLQGGKEEEPRCGAYAVWWSRVILARDVNVTDDGALVLHHEGNLVIRVGAGSVDDPERSCC